MQEDDDLLWIREPFLSSQTDHGFLVVHGHTPTKSLKPDLRSNRLNLDTGACFGGPLTAAAFLDDTLMPVAFIFDNGQIRQVIATRHEGFPFGDDPTYCTGTAKQVSQREMIRFQPRV